MQYLTVFLLVGLGLASAYTIDFDGGLSVDRFENLDSLQTSGWISNQTREALERMVEGFKKTMEEGKDISERAFRKTNELLSKAEELYHKLLDWGIDFGEKINYALEKNGKNFERNSVQQGPVLDGLREVFKNTVSKLKERFCGGNGISVYLMKKAEDIYEKVKNLSVEISEKIKSIFEDLRKKMDKNSAQQEGSMAARLKEAFENIVNRIREAFVSGKGVRGDFMKKAEDIFEKLKNSDKSRIIFEDLRSRIGRNGPTILEPSFYARFRRLRQLLKANLDSETLKEKVEELFGKESEMAKQIIGMVRTDGEKGKQKILDWIDRILPDREERSKFQIKLRARVQAGANIHAF